MIECCCHLHDTVSLLLIYMCERLFFLEILSLRTLTQKYNKIEFTKHLQQC